MQCWSAISSNTCRSPHGNSRRKQGPASALGQQPVGSTDPFTIPDFRTVTASRHMVGRGPHVSDAFNAGGTGALLVR